MSEHREEALKRVGAIGNLRAGRPPVLYPAEQIALAQVHATLYIGEQIGHLIDALCASPTALRIERGSR